MYTSINYVKSKEGAHGSFSNLFIQLRIKPTGKHFHLII